MSFNNRRQKKSTFKKMTIALVLVEDNKFEGDDLINVLSDITFNLININLNVKKSDAGLNGKGYTPIGFVNKFYSTEDGDCMFDVAIFEKHVEIVNAMEDKGNLYIAARAFTNREGKITKIIGLDLINDDADEEDDEE